MKKSSLIIILILLCSAVSIFGQNKNISTIKGKKISTKQLDSFVAGQMDSLKIPGLSPANLGEGFQYLARVLGKILNLTDQELNALFQKEVVKPLKIKSMNFT